ncbi:MAG: ornithine--oxo-acid transaminase [Mycobacteriaceae bacterium]
MTTAPTTILDTEQHIQMMDAHAAHNYAPLPVVATSASGVWITDIDGKRYLDCLSAYSAVNFGHSHPLIISSAQEQLQKLTLTSRALHSDKLAPFCSELAALCKKDLVLPMNTGAEAVESALKVARKWGKETKGISEDNANIVVAQGNFHGRTISIISFSDDSEARDGFGPFTPGFRPVPFGDIQAMRSAIDANTIAVLLEPIQGEAGIIVPPDHYLPAVRELCTNANTLLICDEIQSGLARTGRTFASEHWNVVPDIYVLGKALGGGILPVSAVVANKNILGVLKPGQHGSTFGGNPLAAAVGTTVVRLVASGQYQEQSSRLGKYLHLRLSELLGKGVTHIRGKGLWAGVDIDSQLGTGKTISLLLKERGVLVKDTQRSTLRFAPPLVITESEIDWLITQFSDALSTAKRLNS